MKTQAIIRVGFHLIFWGWNFLFFVITYLGILPSTIGPLIEFTIAGVTPPEFLFTLSIIAVSPALCTILGLKKRHDPGYLMRLFFGFQIPIFFLFTIRLFVIRERTSGSTLVLLTLFVSIVAYGAQLLPQSWLENKRLSQWQWSKWIKLFFCTIMVMTGLYFGFVLLFYAIPGAVNFILGFLKFEWLKQLFDLVFSGVFWLLPFMFIFFGLSFALFVVWPVVLVYLYLSSGYQALCFLADRSGMKLVLIYSLSVFIVWAGIFVISCQQPQTEMFAMFDTMPETPESKDECKKILKQSDEVREGLLNAYLHHYRYVSPVEDNNHIKEMYVRTLNVNRNVAMFVQDIYNLLMSPFLYDGSKDDDAKAAKLYADIFDAPIQKAEKKAIRRALASTYSRSEMKAGLLDIDKEVVWLAKQEIKVVSDRDMAQVELFEVYENTEHESQEIFYSFSLPESSVMTGLWLGNSPNKEVSFKFKVSTRGAAQAVYNQEVKRRVDPALLEQVGPRHYRLRVFPVPPKVFSRYRGSKKKEQPRLYLWMTFNVMQQEKGWPMPRLSEKRNVFWNEKTEFIQNGKSVKHGGKSWFPGFIASDRAFKPLAHEAYLHQGVKVTARPVYDDGYGLPKSKHFAVVIDTSYSMAKQSDRLIKVFKWMKENLSPNNEIDIYICSVYGIDLYAMEDLRGFHSMGSVFFGSLNFGDMIRGFDEKRGEKKYDAMILVTDEGSYELSKDEDKRPSMKIDGGKTPVWLVHLGKMPRAYDDKTLELIQAGRGGVAEGVESVIRRMATLEAVGPSAINVVDGYIWGKSSKNGQQAEDVAPIREDGLFGSIAARQMIVAMSRFMDMEDLKNLDMANETAKKYGIVSPYSSMIVLVNERQEKALEEAEKQDDRFDREVEDGSEILQKPSNPMKTASSIPEPSTIVLMVAGIFALSLFQRFKKMGA